MNHTNRLRLSKLSIGLIVALAAAPAFAQNTTAALGGQVVGADGQPIAGAEVTIVHSESGTVSRVVTGPINAEVTLALPAGRSVTAGITRDSLDRLGMAKGSPASALFKASSVILVALD